MMRLYSVPYFSQREVQTPCRLPIFSGFDSDFGMTERRVKLLVETLGLNCGWMMLRSNVNKYRVVLIISRASPYDVLRPWHLATVHSATVDLTKQLTLIHDYRLDLGGNTFESHVVLQRGGKVCHNFRSETQITWTIMVPIGGSRPRRVVMLACPFLERWRVRFLWIDSSVQRFDTRWFRFLR